MDHFFPIGTPYIDVWWSTITVVSFLNRVGLIPPEKASWQVGQNESPDTWITSLLQPLLQLWRISLVVFHY